MFIFSKNFDISLDEIQCVATTCSFIEDHANRFLKTMLNLYCTSCNQDREFYWSDYIKYTINIVLCLNTCEPICFKLCMMLHTTKLYSFVQFEWPWCSLKVTGSWGTENWSSHSVIKLCEAIEMFMVVDYVRLWRNPVWQMWIVWVFVLLVSNRW